MSAKDSSSIDPKHAVNVVKKLTTLGTLGQYQSDLRSAEKSLEVDSNNAYAWYQKGAALNNLNR
ncbi:MAG: hypothetical protein WAK17_04670, partial [Candidatus Nitrosopolaris sp.]